MNNAYFLKNSLKIKKQLVFAKNNVPFYKKILLTDPLLIKNYNDFCKAVPLVDSNEFLRNPKKFSSSLPHDFVRHSSSTTGNPKKIFLTKNDIRHWAKSGRLTITPYFRKGMTVAHSRRREKHYLSALDKSVRESGGKIITFNPLEKKTLINCLKQADILLEYAELVFYISEKIKNLPINLNKKLIISYVGDKLEKRDVLKIKNSFSSIGVEVEIFSEYSTSEIGPIGCSMSKDTNLFKIIYEDNVFVEMIDTKTGKPSSRGELVATALGRTGSVFIRYKTGDVGRLIFKEHNIFFKLERRKNGIKIASLFFSPDYVFRIIRRKLDCPIFCHITVKKKSFLGIIDINIVTEKKISEREKVSLRTHLLKKLDFIDDINSTVELNLFFEKRLLRALEIRKGFKYTNS